MKIGFLVLLVMAAAAVPLFAGGNNNDTALAKNDIGVGAGWTTGIGLSYRHWFGNEFGFQVNLAPYISKTGGANTQFVSFGLTGLKVLKKSTFVNLFGYVAGSVYYNYQEYQESVYAPSGVYTGMQNVYTRQFDEYVGGGPGIDIHFWRLSVNVMVGLAGHFNSVGDYGLQITGESALYYSF